MIVFQHNFDSAGYVEHAGKLAIVAIKYGKQLDNDVPNMPMNYKN